MYEGDVSLIKTFRRDFEGLRRAKTRKDVGLTSLLVGGFLRLYLLETVVINSCFKRFGPGGGFLCIGKLNGRAYEFKAFH